MSETSNKRLTREEVAELEVGKTTISRRLSICIVLMFSLTILSIPLAQYLIETVEKKQMSRPKACEAFTFPGLAMKEMLNPQYQGW